jgi:hypothetical protein
MVKEYGGRFATTDHPIAEATHEPALSVRPTNCTSATTRAISTPRLKIRLELRRQSPGIDRPPNLIIDSSVKNVTLRG